MGSIVGFTIHRKIPPEAKTRAISAEDRALSRFTHLEKSTISIGTTTLHLWGHAPLSERVHKMPDGTTLALIGSPLGQDSWQSIQENLLKISRPEKFQPPWDGRFIFLQISPDGARWTIWNDWLGSIPVYYTRIGNGRIASTLEPVTVTAADPTSNDFFLPGLVSLLLNGYFLSDWTLYKGVNTLLPDRVAIWDEEGLRAKQLWAVQASQERWETSWDDLVDEMHASSRQAIADVLRTEPRWILPLSSGLDSRLIGAVAAELGLEAYSYAWGPAENTDVIYSREIAKTLHFPWKHIALPKNFLVRYTRQWHDWFGTSMHFQGMYLMSFLDEIKTEPAARTVTGFIGDVLAGDGLNELVIHHSSKSYQVEHEWYSDWGHDQLRAVAKFPIDEALEANAEELKRQIESFPGARHQKLTYLELWNRQRSFISFLSMLKDYWRGTATPFLNRSYARFCLSLPRTALDHRRLLGDVFRRYYGPLAVIPGSYAREPYIPTGSYLIRRRVARLFPSSVRDRLFKRTDNLHICVDFEPIQTHGKDSLWPLFDVWDQLADWLDIQQVEKDYHTVMRSKEDIRPLRRLQAAQTFASHFVSMTQR
ncbi:MAG: hypothetical protein HXY35_03475 [Chloroflexi bacterium]|nr:hypothetical protein [Chloroflexota bacterium]